MNSPAARSSGRPSHSAAPRIVWKLTILLTISCASTLSSNSVTAQTHSPVADWTDDAALNDVFFLDLDTGWAVGDRGVILRTFDGGRSWESIRSPVNCQLDSVFFLSEREGWIVGGFAKPVTHLSTGVVLRTVDGGTSWSLVGTNRLPWMKQIHMESDRIGWAVSQSSPIFRSGLMLTQDGGASWRPFPGDVLGQWTAAARMGANRFCLVGRSRAAAVARNGILETGIVWSTEAIDLQSVAMVDGQHGWAAGDEGTLLITHDGGESWDQPENPIPPELARQFDWRTIVARGDRVWVAGNPGSRIARSDDQGRTWHWVSTGIPFPINRLFFWDESRGWAVGDMGTVLGTMDGGRTWRPLRSASGRVALLGVFGDSSEIPLEFFARHAGNDGHFSAIALIGSSTAAVPDTASMPDRVKLAASNTGVSGFSLASVSAPDEADQDAWRRRIVREVRTWRPDVVICGQVEGSSEAETESLIASMIEVFQSASDPHTYSDQITEAGLEPWRPQKIYVRAGEQSRKDVSLAISQFAPRLGTSLEDYCVIANGLIKPLTFEWESRPGWRLIDCAFASTSTYEALFAGLDPNHLRQVQRDLEPPGPGNLEVMRRQARKWEWLERITSSVSASDDDVEIWSQEVDGMLIGVGELGGGNVLFQLANAHESRLQYEAAARSMHRLIADYPDHPLWDGAMIWLVRYYASTEAYWMSHPSVADPHIEVVSAIDPYFDSLLDLPDTASAIPVELADPVQVPFSIQQRQDEKRFLDLNSDSRRPHARSLTQLLQQRRPHVASLPAVQVSGAAIDRMLRGAEAPPAQSISAARHAGGMWTLISESETWLRERREAPPVPVVLCRRLDAPPTLDGSLDDDAWQGLSEIQLGLMGNESRQRATETRLRVAYDAEFLFLAIEGDLDPESVTPLLSHDARESDSESPRPRDSDLDDRDRIWFSFDVDRDYASAFSLEIDSSGRCRESALGIADWNPQWFIANGRTANRWTLEIAIPFSQLGIAPPLGESAWSIDVRRCVPGEPTPSAVQRFLGEPRLNSLMLFTEN